MEYIYIYFFYLEDVKDKEDEIKFLLNYEFAESAMVNLSQARKGFESTRSSEQVQQCTVTSLINIIKYNVLTILDQILVTMYCYKSYKY